MGKRGRDLGECFGERAMLESRGVDTSITKKRVGLEHDAWSVHGEQSNSWRRE